jgi:hypothetical protein
MAKTKTVQIKNCTQCPHVELGHCQGTVSFACRHPKTYRHWVPSGFLRWDGTTGRDIAANCENRTEYPKTFPKWCPLKDK